ncbi:MAG TPA: rhomboid family intramembrane serine protease [Bacteroidales bacterium]|mgnify:FL=1|nr:rhomboid family intramembrane serine protease [Bacteroidales bacterium]HPS72696.1 rhomboid family intramembrane serine protease [Bacteroidales bacterium]
MYVTISLIVITILISVLGFSQKDIISKCQFNAYDIRHSGQWYRFLTYGFFHEGWIHLLINMIVLYSFGEMAEKGYLYYFRSQYVLFYLLLYFGAMIISVIPAFFKHRNDVFYNALGSSGAVSAIVFASILLKPDMKIYLFFIPVGIPCIAFGLGYLVYEFIMSRRGKDHIAHDAHFWGAIFGIVFTLACKPQIFSAFLKMLERISL